MYLSLFEIICRQFILWNTYYLFFLNEKSRQFIVTICGSQVDRDLRHWIKFVFGTRISLGLFNRSVVPACDSQTQRPERMRTTTIFKCHLPTHLYLHFAYLCIDLFSKVSGNELLAKHCRARYAIKRKCFSLCVYIYVIFQTIFDNKKWQYNNFTLFERFVFSMRGK